VFIYIHIWSLCNLGTNYLESFIECIEIICSKIEFIFNNKHLFLTIAGLKVFYYNIYIYIIIYNIYIYKCVYVCTYIYTYIYLSEAAAELEKGNTSWDMKQMIRYLEKNNHGKKIFIFSFFHFFSRFLFFSKIQIFSCSIK
jgi:hypothetical protein